MQVDERAARRTICANISVFGRFSCWGCAVDERRPRKLLREEEDRFLDARFMIARAGGSKMSAGASLL